MLQLIQSKYLDYWRTRIYLRLALNTYCEYYYYLIQYVYGEVGLETAVLLIVVKFIYITRILTLIY